jgi:hypothetical protein
MNIASTPHPDPPRPPPSARPRPPFQRSSVACACRSPRPLAPPQHIPPILNPATTHSSGCHSLLPPRVHPHRLPCPTASPPQDGSTALHVVVLQGHLDVFHTLLAVGADINAKDYKVGNPPHPTPSRARRSLLPHPPPSALRHIPPPPLFLRPKPLPGPRSTAHAFVAALASVPPRLHRLTATYPLPTPQHRGTLRCIVRR